MLILTGIKLDEQRKLDKKQSEFTTKHTNEEASEKELVDIKIYISEVITVYITLNESDLSLIHLLKHHRIQQIFIMCQISVAAIFN